MTWGTVAAAHPGERAAGAKSHDLTAGLTKTFLSCAQLLAGCEFKVALSVRQPFPVCPKEPTQDRGRASQPTTDINLL